VGYGLGTTIQYLRGAAGIGFGSKIKILARRREHLPWSSVVQFILHKQRGIIRIEFGVGFGGACPPKHVWLGWLSFCIKQSVLSVYSRVLLAVLVVRVGVGTRVLQAPRLSTCDAQRVVPRATALGTTIKYLRGAAGIGLGTTN
jgi:hypothetical protein